MNRSKIIVKYLSTSYVPGSELSAAEGKTQEDVAVLVYKKKKKKKPFPWRREGEGKRKTE